MQESSDPTITRAGGRRQLLRTASVFRAPRSSRLDRRCGGRPDRLRIADSGLALSRGASSTPSHPPIAACRTRTPCSGTRGRLQLTSWWRSSKRPTDSTAAAASRRGAALSLSVRSRCRSLLARVDFSAGRIQRCHGRDEIAGGMKPKAGAVCGGRPSNGVCPVAPSLLQQLVGTSAIDVRSGRAPRRASEGMLTWSEVAAGLIEHRSAADVGRSGSRSCSERDR
jgi:hypothetical protein